MSDFESFGSLAPDEGEGGGIEELSEEAKQRFAGAHAKTKAARKKEQKSRKRDSQVAGAIGKFMKDNTTSYLAVLLARLIERNCPAEVILALLSLIDEESLKEVTLFLQQDDIDTTAQPTQDFIEGIDNAALLDWIVRLQLVLSVEPERTINNLMTDATSLDGTMLHATSYILKAFLKTQGKAADQDMLDQLTSTLLQVAFNPFIHHYTEEEIIDED